jgi:hypothetical protein
LIDLGEGVPLSRFIDCIISPSFGVAGRGDAGGERGGSESRFPFNLSSMGSRRTGDREGLSSQEVCSTSDTAGEGSGSSGERFRNKGVGETGTLSSNQLIGALQEAPLRLRSGAGGGEFGVAAGGFGDGGNDVSIFLSAKYSEVGDGLSGKGDVLCGSGGAVLIKLLNDLTGLSIPSSDEVDLFMCRNGDGRKWPPVSWLRIITTCGPKEVGCSGSVDEKSNAARFLPSSRRVVETKGVKCTCGSSLAAALGAFQRLDKADAVV